ncbi:MAG: histidine phosphatase family protein [Rhodospirillaceae bacterium]
MTKTLILLRHLKSDWSDAALSDRERPLNARGNAAGPLVRDALAARCPRPEVVLCSPARRTRDTLAHVAEAFPEAEARIVPALYEASRNTLVRLAADLPEAAQTALIIGHNPGLLEFAWHLADPDALANHPIFLKFPTGGVIAFALPHNTWIDAAYGACRVVDSFFPKQLG